MSFDGLKDRWTGLNWPGIYSLLHFTRLLLFLWPVRAHWGCQINAIKQKKTEEEELEIENWTGEEMEINILVDRRSSVEEKEVDRLLKKGWNGKP